MAPEQDLVGYVTGSSHIDPTEEQENYLEIWTDPGLNNSQSRDGRMWVALVLNGDPCMPGRYMAAIVVESLKAMVMVTPKELVDFQNRRYINNYVDAI